MDLIIEVGGLYKPLDHCPFNKRPWPMIALHAATGWE
jgi:hypothetical protein